MRPFSAINLLSLAAGSLAVSIGPTANLVIANKNISPDGFSRSAVLAGTSDTDVAFPGPLIRSTKGDTFRINVVDNLTDTTMLVSTSIHWHGMFQKGTSWADGPVGVNQCPISPGQSFLYEFAAPDQAGTFWYHSHHSTQYCDGLRGPLVIYDPADPHLSKYDIDDENTIITLADWYHKPAPSLQGVPQVDATLINGLGRFSGGPASPLAVINVTPNKRYRFRLVSTSCDPNYIFSIDGHNITIIEVDGVNVEPLVVDSIQIFAGQRYSFVLTADQPIENYWVRAQPNFGISVFTGGLNSAILRYSGAPEADPTTLSALSNPLRETNLHPLENPGAPGIPGVGAADVNLNMLITRDPATRLFSVNGATFQPPSVPVLLQILSGTQKASDLLPKNSVYALPPNSVIEVSIPGGSTGSPHPIHLHGHTFDVVRSAGSSVYNYVNPVRRDVVSIGALGDNVTIRFETDNAGPWIMHCHIDFHLEQGLAVVFAEDIPDIATSTQPASWDNLCPTYQALPPQVFNKV